MKFCTILLIVVLCVLHGGHAVDAQTDLVATLEVLSPGVEMKRAGTDVWLPITFESLVAAGDAIRTDASGTARIIFFEDGTTTELQPATEVVIREFEGDGRNFTLSFEVLGGITKQQFARILDRGSSYRIITPGINMTVRGTDFSVRVEDDGRSSLLTHEGLVDAGRTGVEPGFGVRAPSRGQLSDVVPATSFAELDAALDGCTGSSPLTGDIQLNIRQAPDRTARIITTVFPDEITLIMGQNASADWYRVPLDEARYGWVAAESVRLDTVCSLLREFPDDHTE